MIKKPDNSKNTDFDPDLDMDDAGFEYDGDAVDADFEGVDADELLENEQDWQEEEQPKANKGSRKRSSYTGGEKKGMSFNTMVIIGAVVLGAGVLVFNVMNQSKQQQTQGAGFQSSMNVASVIDGGLTPEASTAPATTQEVAAGQDGGVAAPTAPNDTAQPGGFLNEGLGDVGQQAGMGDDAIPPQPAPVAPADMAGATQDALTPLPEETTVIDVAANSAVPQDIQIQDAPDITAAPSQDESVQIDVANTAPEIAPPAQEAPMVPEMAQSAPAPASAPVMDSGQMAQLEEKLSAILSRMDKIESDMDQIRDGQSGDIKKLEKTVMSLKEDLGSVKSAPAPKPKKETPTTKPKEAKPAKAPVIEPYPKVVTPKVSDVANVPAPKPVAAPVVSKADPAMAPSSGKWELRAAQPGRAWVSKPGDRDMQSVEVGQKLPGVGTIAAIEYQNGRWVVRGSEGQITQ